MIDLPLSRAEEDAFMDTLRESHQIRLEIEILNRDEKPVGSLTAPSHQVVDGAVQVEADEDVTHSLNLRLLDPHHKLAFTPDHPAQGGLYADNFISVRYCVYVPSLDKWVEVPVFRGPLTLFEHTGGTVTIEAQGKESLGLAPHVVVQGYTLRKNTRIDEALERVMRKQGERRFSIPRLSRRKLHSDWVVRPGQEPWKVIQGGGEEASGKVKSGLINHTGDRPHQAFYDGRGKLVVRRLRKSRVFTFGERTLLSKPVLRFDVLEARNLVRVRGGKPKGAKHAVSGTAKLSRNHPLSSRAMARDDTPRYLAELITADNLKTTRECERRAEDILDHRKRAALDASFECLPVPHLEPLDNVAVETEEGRLEFTAKSFTIPLTSTESMSVGYTKRIKQRRPKRRKK